jgi:hypothetical protein
MDPFFLHQLYEPETLPRQIPRLTQYQNPSSNSAPGLDLNASKTQGTEPLNIPLPFQTTKSIIRSPDQPPFQTAHGAEELPQKNESTTYANNQLGSGTSQSKINPETKPETKPETNQQESSSDDSGSSDESDSENETHVGQPDPQILAAFEHPVFKTPIHNTKRQNISSDELKDGSGKSKMKPKRRKKTDHSFLEFA